MSFDVCTHCGAIVVEGEGHARSLRCRYHGRKYSLDGKFVSMPEFDTTVGFPSEMRHLPSDVPAPRAAAPGADTCRFDEVIAAVQLRARADCCFYELSVITGHVDGLFDKRKLGAVLRQLSRRVPSRTCTRDSQRSWTTPATGLSDSVGEPAVGIAKPGQPAFDLPRDHPNARSVWARSISGSSPTSRSTSIRGDCR